MLQSFSLATAVEFYYSSTRSEMNISAYCVGDQYFVAEQFHLLGHHLSDIVEK